MTYADEAELFWIAAHARRRSDEYRMEEVIQAGRELCALRQSARPLIAARAAAMFAPVQVVVAGSVS